MELSAVAPELIEKGINVAAITYDSVDIQRRFVGKHKITYPVLSDLESKVINQLGILNTEIPQDTRFHGVPYPGIYVLDGDNTVVAKFAEKDYRDRPLLDDVVEAAQALVDSGGDS